MRLPHTDHLETRSAQECVDHLRNTDATELPIVVSRDFYAREDQEIFPEIYTQYQIKYQFLIGEFMEVLGAPKFTGDDEDSRYPDWAVGEHVTVWEKGSEVLWLRLNHKESTAPIEIVLAKQ